MIKNIGLLFDSFDPVCDHVIGQAVSALTKLDLDEIWFLIPEDNELDEFEAPFIMRHEMLMRVIEDNSLLRILPVKDSDIYNNKELKRIYKEDKELNLYLIVDSDEYTEISQLEKLTFLKWVDLILINDKNLDNINKDISLEHIIEDQFETKKPKVYNGDFTGVPKEALDIIIKNKLYL